MAGGGRASALYVGTTTHVRRRPAANRFAYGLVMAGVDLSELESGALDCWPLFSSTTALAATALLPRDHLGGGGGGELLSARVRRVVREQAGLDCAGPVVLLAGLRVLGLEFNPVSFYYLLNGDGSGDVQALVAEVNNIPWFEQHLYVLTPAGGGGGCGGEGGGPGLVRFCGHAKAFHVSPFMPVAGVSYDWLVSHPAERLAVRIGLSEAGERFFSAAIDLRRRPFGPPQLLWLLVTHPLMAVTVVLGIMYEAGKLWRRGFAFFPHPEGAETASSRAIAQVVTFFVDLKARFGKPARGEAGKVE